MAIFDTSVTGLAENKFGGDQRGINRNDVVEARNELQAEDRAISALLESGTITASRQITRFRNIVATANIRLS